MQCTEHWLYTNPVTTLFISLILAICIHSIFITLINKIAVIFRGWPPDSYEDDGAAIKINMSNRRDDEDDSN